MADSDGCNHGYTPTRISVRFLLFWVTLCAILFALAIALQERWTGLFCCWGMCVIGQSMLANIVWRYSWRPRQGNASWRRKTAGALAMFGMCIMLYIFVVTFWASAYTRVYYGEANLEWLMGLAFMVMAAVPTELVILIVCVLVACERPILLLQTANLASAMFPGIYGILFPVY